MRSCYGRYLACLDGAATSGRSRQALLRLSLPLFFLVATPVVTFLALAQINLISGVASVVELAAAAIMFLAGAWIVWRIAPVLAEALIATPKINTESINAHLIRICTRLLGMSTTATLLAVGASRLGLPLESSLGWASAAWPSPLRPSRLWRI